MIVKEILQTKAIYKILKRNQIFAKYILINQKQKGRRYTMNIGTRNKILATIIYPFVLFFDFVIVYLIIHPLIMLEDNEVNVKNTFTEMYGTPKRFFVTTWNWCQVIIIEIINS